MEELPRRGNRIRLITNRTAGIKGQYYLVLRKTVKAACGCNSPLYKLVSTLHNWKDGGELVDAAITFYLSALSGVPGHHESLTAETHGALENLIADKSLPGDVRAFATWRWECDINLPALLMDLDEDEERALGKRFFTGDSLGHLCASFTSASYGGHYVSGSLASGSLLKPALVEYAGYHHVPVLDFLEKCQIEDTRFRSRYYNTTMGASWLRSALTTNSAEELTLLSLRSWDDYSPYAGPPNSLDSIKRHFETSLHPMEPDCALVARWRLANSIHID